MQGCAGAYTLTVAELNSGHTTSGGSAPSGLAQAAWNDLDGGLAARRITEEHN